MKLLLKRWRDKFIRFDIVKRENSDDISGAKITTNVSGGKVGKIINLITSGITNITILGTEQLLVLVSVILVVAGGVYSAYWYSIQPRKLTGDFNIAVAQFGEITDESIESTELSMSISNSLQKYLESTFKPLEFGIQIEVSNKNMPLITEAKDAEKLASQVHAEIVIYGSVYRFGNEAKFSPRFYISKKFDTNELTGETKLEQPIIVTIKTMKDQGKVEDELKTRSAVLISFTKSLIYLSDNNLDEAIVAAQESIKISDDMSEPFVGEENLFLLAAQIELARDNFDSANNYLDQVVVLNPDYARAYIGRGNLYYGQAIQTRPYDDLLLNKAIEEYKKALEAKDQPRAVNIPVKAHRSIGNVYFLKAQNQNGEFDLYKKAIEHYKFVVGSYEKSKDPAIQEMAALTYFSMGIAYERTGDLQEAIRAYENSLKATSDSKFKETVENQLKITKQTENPP
jgi:tetratricopeptide (TPR) repeat protein